MNTPQFKQYTFSEPAHWQTGVYKNLRLSKNNGFIVPTGFELESIPATGAKDHTPALDSGPCDRLHWVRIDSGELMCLHSAGLQMLGKISNVNLIRKLSVGISRLWLQTDSDLNLYALNPLQPLKQITNSRLILDMTGDGENGIWLLLGNDDQATALQHVDQYGQYSQAPIELSKILKPVALAVSECGKKIIVLDNDLGQTDCCNTQKVSWRVFIVDACSKKIVDTFEGEISDNEKFEPRLLCIDNQDLIHLLDPELAIIQSINLNGVPAPRQHLNLNQSALPIAAITAGSRISLSTASGIVSLRSSSVMMAQGESSHSTFVTPSLVSPIGSQQGWQRATFEIELPAGSTLEVSYVTSDDQTLKSRADRVLQNQALTPANKLNQLDQLFDWNNDDSIIYVGQDSEEQSTNYSFPLHKIDQTYLWLRFRFYAQDGNKPPAFKSLKVTYPNQSYLNYLPAVYQHNQESAAKLKSFLAIFEAMFEDLDATIDHLPRQINPDTAPDSWLPFLLSWLGLPTSKQLNAQTQRRLLISAPELLAKRGTIGALRHLLQILGGEYSEFSIRIEDIASGPTPWVLQPQNRIDHSARLGCDTLIVAQMPPSFRLGKISLGADKGVPLGKGQSDPQLMFNQRNGLIMINIALDSESRQKLEPIINKFLPYFIPAHCRYRVEFTTNTSQPWKQRLDKNLRLSDGQGAQLGSETIVGRFQLPADSGNDFTLDRSSRLGSDRLIN